MRLARTASLPPRRLLGWRVDAQARHRARNLEEVLVGEQPTVGQAAGQDEAKDQRNGDSTKNPRSVTRSNGSKKGFRFEREAAG